MCGVLKLPYVTLYYDWCEDVDMTDAPSTKLGPKLLRVVVMVVIVCDGGLSIELLLRRDVYLRPSGKLGICLMIFGHRLSSNSAHTGPSYHPKHLVSSRGGPTFRTWMNTHRNKIWIMGRVG